MRRQEREQGRGDGGVLRTLGEVVGGGEAGLDPARLGFQRDREFRRHGVACPVVAAAEHRAGGAQVVAAAAGAVAFEREFARHQVGERARFGTVDEQVPGDPLGVAVASARLAHLAAGHRDLAEQLVRVHRQVGRPAGEEVARLPRAVHGRVEPCVEAVVAGVAVEDRAADQRGRGGQSGDARRLGVAGEGFLRGDRTGAVELEHAARDQPVDLETGFRGACRCHLGEDAVRGGEPPLEQGGDAAEARQSGPVRQRPVGDQPVGGRQSDRAFAQPPLEAAGVEKDGRGEFRVAGLGGVAHGLHSGAAPRQGGGDAPVHPAAAAGELAAHGFGAVLAQQGMQAADGRCPGADVLQQPGEARQAGRPFEGAGAVENLVEEIPVEPVEQAEVEREPAVGGREGAPEPGGDPAADGVAHDRRRAGRRSGRVAAHAQGDRPAARLRGDGGELRTGQVESEEAGDFAPREAQVVRGDDFGAAVEDVPRRGQGRGQPTVGESHVQARGRIPEQAVEEGDGVRVGEALEFVERKHQRLAPGLDGVQQELGAGVRGAQGGAVVAERGVDVDAGALQGEREVGVERGRVVVGEREPGDGHAGLRGGPAGGGKHGGLAETARRGQNGQRSPRGGAAGRERRAFAVVFGRRRDGHPLGQQPAGRRAAAHGAPARGHRGRTVMPREDSAPPPRRRRVNPQEGCMSNKA